MENGIQLMFDLSEVITSPKQTVGVSELLVRTSQLQENEPDLTETEALLSEKCSEFLKKSPKKIVPNGLSTKMLRECLAAIEGGDFGAILLEMGELGYDTEWQLFNTKNFGVPQNRERVYTVGHLRNRGSKQIFPLEGADGEDSVCEVKQIGQRNRPGRNNPNEYRVYDQTGIAPCLKTMGGGGGEPSTIVPVQFGIDYNPSGKERPVANALVARYYKGMAQYQQSGTAVAIPVLTPDRAEKRQNDRRFKDNGEDMFTLTAQDRHGVGITVPIREAVSKGYTDAHEGDSINLSMPNSETRRGRVGKKQAQTLDCACNQGILVKLNDNSTVYAVWYEKYQCYIAIRKLTPKECFRLQGWTDDYFEKAQFVNSDSQLYKQAGNGVTVDVVYEIAKQLSLFEEEEQ